jgi:hypothetical protein
LAESRRDLNASSGKAPQELHGVLLILVVAFWNMRFRFAAASLVLPLLFAQTSTGPTIPKLNDANPDIVNLVAQDQWDRGDDFFGSQQAPPKDKIDWDKVNKRDEQRRDAVRKLLTEGTLQTGKDYRFAALIFQHSQDSAGYLLAHVLAVTAVGKGEPKARWLAAATMDRYLMSLKQPQVFGTQFHQDSGAWTMDPYDRGGFSDAIRASWCVASQSEQEQILKDIRDGKPFRSTYVAACK